MSTRNTIILLILVAIASAGLTRYYFPSVQFKNTETIKEVVHNDIQTVVKTIERPDGTKETTETTVDHSTKQETSKSQTIIAAKPQWMFDVGARANLEHISDRDTIVYDLQVQRRVLGPFYVGGKISTDKSVGVSLGMEF